MKRNLALVLTLVACFAAGPLCAQGDAAKSEKDQVAQLEQQVKEMTANLKQLQAAMAQLDTAAKVNAKAIVGNSMLIDQHAAAINSHAASIKANGEFIKSNQEAIKSLVKNAQEISNGLRDLRETSEQRLTEALGTSRKEFEKLDQDSGKKLEQQLASKMDDLQQRMRQDLDRRLPQTAQRADCGSTTLALTVWSFVLTTLTCESHQVGHRFTLRWSPWSSLSTRTCLVWSAKIGRSTQPLR